MSPKIRNYKERWRRLKSSSHFHNVLVFIAFVGIAILFWIIMAFNDNVTETFRVNIVYDNVPDSITFISDPPTEMDVTLRDKGTNLLRSSVVKRPKIHLNFKNFAKDGIFRISSANMNAVMKNAFGNSIQIQSASVDSIVTYYTGEHGKRVPVVVRVDLSAANGYIISGMPIATERMVTIYSYGNAKDTIEKVYTESVIARDLSKPTTFTAKINPLPNIKVVPATVEVEIPVESLVKKDTYANVEADNVPAGESLLLFPNRVPVSCYVPMSLYNEGNIPMTVKVDYEDTKIARGKKVPIKMKDYPEYVASFEVQIDSVEYTIVRN